MSLVTTIAFRLDRGRSSKRGGQGGPGQRDCMSERVYAWELNSIRYSGNQLARLPHMGYLA